MHRSLIAIGLFALVAALAQPSVAAALEPVRVALLSDPHVNRGTSGKQPGYKAHFETAIAMVNTSKVDFVVITGDLTENGKDDERDDLLIHLKKFKPPVLWVPGNHDIGNKIMNGKGTVTADNVTKYEAKLGPSFYVTNIAGIRLIGINSPILGSDFPVEKKMWTFLEKELGEKSDTRTIVFSHYPTFLKKPDEGGGDYFNMEPGPRKRLLDLMEKGGVRTMLSGHLHRDLHHKANGITFISTRPISFGINAQQVEGWTLVTIPAEGDATFELKDFKAKKE